MYVSSVHVGKSTQIQDITVTITAVRNAMIVEECFAIIHACGLLPESTLPGHSTKSMALKCDRQCQRRTAILLSFTRSHQTRRGQLRPCCSSGHLLESRSFLGLGKLLVLWQSHVSVLIQLPMLAEMFGG